MKDDNKKDDPLKGPKKITMGVFVSVLALLGIGAFASFHWLCSDYFIFKANEVAERSKFDALRQDNAKEETKAKKRLADIAKQVADAETNAIVRISNAEMNLSNRLDALENEYVVKKEQQKAKMADESKRLEVELENKKHDLAVLLKGYIERFNEKTNDLERAIAGKRNELAEVKRRVELLPDLQRQCEEAEAALAAAKANRDAALQKEREAQTSFNKWNGKVEQVKVDYSTISNRTDGLKKEIIDLIRQTNGVVIALAKLNAEMETVNGQIVQGHAEMERINGEIAKARLKKEGVDSETDEAEAARDKAIRERDAALLATEAARDKKREAESARDKAIAECEQAKKARDEANRAFERRQVEIDGLIKSMEELLKKTKGQVESALATNQIIKTAESAGQKEVEE